MIINMAKNILKDRVWRAIIVLSVILMCLESSYAAECSAISRVNNSSNAVLTSSKYNTDHNTSYTALNAIIGSTCTLPLASITQTDLDVWDNGIHQGCKVEYSNASTVTIDRCIMSLGGNRVKTTSSASVEMDCADCSAEISSTRYYVYIKSDSNGATLTGFFSTSSPNDDGFNGSGDKVIGRLYNQHSSDIDRYSIDQWWVNGFVPQVTGVQDYGEISITGTTTPPTFGSQVVKKHYWHRDGEMLEGVITWKQSTGGSDGAGDYVIDIAETSNDLFNINTTKTGTYTTVIGGATVWEIENQWGYGSCGATGLGSQTGVLTVYDADSFRMVLASSTGQRAFGGHNDSCELGDATMAFSTTYRLPIIGWEP